ncbi:MAG: Ldh family oxidoreductase [Alphaproteobacteria bacterium]|nr:Ldh family oxidoreductase [Alphaproteobacteria bacterium]
MGRKTLAELEALAARAFVRSKTSEANARSVARALVAAEADGLSSHGLSRLAAYCDQAIAGKVDGFAAPKVARPRPSVVAVDAASGFAFPALDVGIAAAVPAARETGLAAIPIGRSHHFGVAGHAVERLAKAGLIGLALGNSPAAIAPWGGARPLFGTNPIAFAWPRAGRHPLVIDLSLSKVARGRIMVAAQKGEAIPEGWALDAEGKPTTDAKAALGGAMIPMGDAKGAALVLMVELLAVALTGSNFGFEASSFFDAKGPPPHVGQMLLALDVSAFSADAEARAEAVFAAMAAQPGVRLPGERRFKLRAKAKAEGVDIPNALLTEIERRAG